MFCNKCGKLNSTGARFCDKCGSPLQEKTNEISNGRKKKLAWKPFLFVLVGIIAVIVIVGIVLRTPSVVQTNDTQPVETTGLPAEVIINTEGDPTITPVPTLTSIPSGTVETTETTPETYSDDVFGSYEDINRVCSVQATVETNSYACVVYTDYSDNPYDFIWDYGSEYQAYVDACDWTLVFDAEYYKTTFPMLALQYHDDDALLLQHFQTVGIHEGRQGNASFNVCAYANNCSDEVYDSFGRNFAAYYIYYMMNYETESTVNTVSRDSGNPVYQQMTCVYTALQLTELNSVNGYRAEVNVADIAINSELCALANYRAYLNSHDGYIAHDWAINNDPLIRQYLELMGSTNEKYAENTVTQHNSIVGNYAAQYRTSDSHYRQMINGEYNMIGCSNLYYSEAANTGSQFDTFALDLNTVI